MTFGARLSSSDFGDGALDFRAFDMQAVCFNGMVAESLMRQVHLGSKIPENIVLSERTFELDSRTQASAIGDIVGQTLSKKAITARAMQIQDASNEVIDLDAEVKKLPKTRLMSQSEVNEVGKVLMANNPSDGVEGKPTLWKLAQAVSRVGQNGTDRRKREMDEIAGMLLTRASKN